MNWQLEGNVNLKDWFAAINSKYQIDYFTFTSSNNIERFKNITNVIFRYDRASMKLLDYEFDSDFGAEEAPDFIIWTMDVIVVKHEFDGHESMRIIAKHPGFVSKYYKTGLYSLVEEEPDDDHITDYKYSGRVVPKELNDMLRFDDIDIDEVL